MEEDTRKGICLNPLNQPAMLHFSCVKRAYIMASSPLYVLRLVKCIVLGLSAVKQSSFVIPHSRAAIPNDNPSGWMPNEDKSSFWEQPPVWKELRPCVSEFVKEAGRWRRDDTGLRVEEQRVVVRRMNSDWRSAQWQLNDLRSVDSVSINQTALSCSPTFFFSPSPFGSNFSLCIHPQCRERALCSRSLSISFVFCFSMSVFASPSLHRPCLYLLFFLTCFLAAPSTGQFSFLLHLCIDKILKEWGHFTIILYHPCWGLSTSSEKQSLPIPRELDLEKNSCTHWLWWSLNTVCDPCRWGKKFRHGNSTHPDMLTPGT